MTTPKLLNSFILFLLIVFITPLAYCQEIYTADENAAPSAVRYIRWNSDGSMQSESISMMKDSSQVFRFEKPIIRAAVSNPNICDIVTAGDKDILVNAREAGAANLIVWDQNDQVANYVLDVTTDIKKLQTILSNIDPQADIQILPFNKTAAVYGSTETSVKLKEMQDAAKAFDEKTLIYVKIREPKQVLLEVRFAEIKRVGTKDYKLDIDTIFDGLIEDNTVATFSGFVGQNALTAENDGTFTTSRAGGGTIGTFDRPNQTTTSLGLGIISNRGFLVAPYLKWLENKNVLKVIARPNLLAKDGEESSFVVGGEYPVPTIVNNAVNITYRDFGNSLKFTPEILDNGIIRLKTEAFVSELDFSSPITSGGSTVPIVLKKEYKSVSELKDNETLVIGGFMSQKVNKIVRKMPILGDIPVFSSVFKSEEYSRTDNELIVILTPHIVKPMDLGEKKVFFDEKKIKAAIVPFKSEYTDSTGDVINDLFMQGETRKEFALDDNRPPTPPRQKFVQSSSVNKVSNSPNTNFTTRQNAVVAKPAPSKPISQPASYEGFSTLQDRPSASRTSLNKGVFDSGYLK